MAGNIQNSKLYIKIDEANDKGHLTEVGRLAMPRLACAEVIGAVVVVVAVGPADLLNLKG